MLPQAQAFLEECDALYAIVSPLSDEELETKTAFKGWTLNNVIGHLHMWNYAADTTLQDGAEFQRFFAEVAKGMERLGGGLNNYEREWLGSLKGRALVEAWRTRYRSMAENYGKANASTRVKWAGPDMTVRSKITARLMETWAHAQEIYDQLGLVRQDGDRLENIVILGKNTYGWTFANRGQKPPGPMPHLRLTAPSGNIWTYGDASEVELIEGQASEFCQVVTQTRNVADTNLKVKGKCATAWMSVAQCFAGAVEDPPAPGTRKIISKL